jgi:hypothetical protein
MSEKLESNLRTRTRYFFFRPSWCTVMYFKLSDFMVYCQSFVFTSTAVQAISVGVTRYPRYKKVFSIARVRIFGTFGFPSSGIERFL